MLNKKFFVILSALGLMSPVVEAARFHVITTTDYTAALAREIAGDKAEVETLVPPGFNADLYSPRPQDLFKIHRANLFIMIGLNLEDWARDVVNAADNPNLAKAEIYHGIKLLDIPKGNVDYSFGDIHPFGNPHFQLDPEAGRIMARNIHEALVYMDPADKTTFDKNLANFEAKLAEGEKRWSAEMAPFKGMAFIPYHESWDYFAEAYHLIIPEPPKTIEEKPGFVPSPRRVEEVVQLAKDKNVKLIVTEPYYDVSIAKTIAERLGIPFLNISLYDIGLNPQEKDYISMMDYTIHQFAQAMGGHGR
jgi:zinc/manganese transport system substrate-binding protein